MSLGRGVYQSDGARAANGDVTPTRHHASRPSHGGSRHGRGPSQQQTNGSSMLNGYHDDIASGFREDTRHNPRNVARPQSSALLNVNDPIQVHLLVETALGDAKEYEILSPEEVDELKKQVKLLTQRIGQTKQNLTVQSKYRDAAIAMTRLYSSEQGYGANKNDSVLQERAACESKCEELAAELWNLEKKLMEPQKRLLKHTAGILQMTHKGPKKAVGKATPAHPPSGGMPGSPESMYTYQNRNSGIETFGPNDHFLDERSLYREASESDAWKGIRDVDAAANQGQLDSIKATEDKLEELNKKLRKFIIKMNPEDDAYSKPPHKHSRSKSKANTNGLPDQLDYLEKSLAKIDNDAALYGNPSKESEAAMEETLEELNREIRNVLLPYDADRPEPPKLSGTGLEQQLLYFQDTVNSVEMELARASNVSTRTLGNQESIDQMETALIGLWDMMQSGLAEAKQRKQERLQRELANGVKEEMSDSDDEQDTEEAFSMPAFAARFTSIYRSAMRLKDQKRVLQRQITQQRDLNSRSDSSKDQELAQKTAEVDQLRQQLQSASRTASDAQRTAQLLEQRELEIADLRQEISILKDELKEAEIAAVSSKDRANMELELKSLKDELAQRNRLLAATERELASAKRDSKAMTESNGRLIEADTKIASLTKSLAQAQENVKQAEAKNKTMQTESESRLARSTAELKGAEAKDQAAMRQIAALNKQLAEASEASSRLEAAGFKIAALHKELDDTRDARDQINLAEQRLLEQDERITDLTADLAEAASEMQVLIAEKDRVAKERDKLAKDLSVMESEHSGTSEEEVDKMRIEMARLTTEVTIARAELEGAYGSRAERAREVRTDPALQREVEELGRRNAELLSQLAAIQNARLDGGDAQKDKMDELRRELRETIEEYEILTKASVEWEREREEMERTVDRLRSEREQVEERLQEERVRWLGVKSPTLESALATTRPGDATSPSNVAQLTSTLVLKNEFKKMMRDMRAENMKVLKAEQAERRRIEDELRSMKRTLGPGRSGLSQSIGN